MVKFFYSDTNTGPPSKMSTQQFDPNENYDFTWYDVKRDGYDMYINRIVLESTDQNIYVSLITIDNKVINYEETQDDLNLNQIIQIQIKTKQNGVIYDTLIDNEDSTVKPESESKDVDNLWMFFINNILIFLLFAIVVMISVYVYKTIKTKRYDYT